MPSLFATVSIVSRQVLFLLVLAAASLLGLSSCFTLPMMAVGNSVQLIMEKETSPPANREEATVEQCVKSREVCVFE